VYKQNISSDMYLESCIEVDLTSRLFGERRHVEIIDQLVINLIDDL